MLFHVGRKLWTYFKYEKLSVFYYLCGVVGHKAVNCSSRAEVFPLKCGPWTRYTLIGHILSPNELFMAASLGQALLL